jgi:hypothetical protein
VTIHADNLVAATVASFLTTIGFWLRGAIKRGAKPWEPFEPGICDDLPLYPWGWDYKSQVFRCPVCSGNNGTNQPPYCAERGGHFHFKCVSCGYEWAMRTVDYKPPDTWRVLANEVRGAASGKKAPDDAGVACRMCGYRHAPPECVRLLPGDSSA